MGIKGKAAAGLSLYLLLWLLMLTAFAGIIALAAGIFMAIALGLGPMPAAFIVGGILIGIVVLAVLIAFVVLKPSRGSEAKHLRRDPETVLEQQLRPWLGDKVTNWTQANSGLVVAGALAAGVTLGVSPRLRSALYGAVAPLLTRQTLRAIQRFSDND